MGAPISIIGVNSGSGGTALVGLVTRYHVAIIMAALIATPISFFSFPSMSLIRVFSFLLLEAHNKEHLTVSLYMALSS